MRKTILVCLLVLLFSIYIASPVSVFLYNETDLVSLEPEAQDPDSEELSFYYTQPLNESGEWQTTYGDEGKYEVNITVTDGELSDSQVVLIVVKRKEMAPTIETIKPGSETVNVTQGNNVKFAAVGDDLNNDELNYRWYIDDELVSEGKEMVLAPDYASKESYTVKVEISDGVSKASNNWNVYVEKVDIDKILDGIKDANFTETDVVRLNIPNLEKYGLTYKISEPIGNDNYWLTDYEDYGEYVIDFNVEGKGYQGLKQIKINILNKDRLPEFNMDTIYLVKEDSELKIEADAKDPDDEIVTYSATGLPKGAEFIDNVITFNPGFDTVTKDNVVDYVMDKFRVLGKVYNTKIIAVTNSGKSEKGIIIIVQDNNRPFTLNVTNMIEVNEGEKVKISPSYTDPDNDKVTFRYEGWMTSSERQTGYNDAGEYYVKVIGSDGYNEDYQFVKILVKDTNREPVFERLKDYTLKENETISFELKALDPDKDEVEFLVKNLPVGAKLEDDIFTFTPDFDFVRNGSGKAVVSFIASDGKNGVIRNSTFTVENFNRAPEIVDYSKDVSVKAGDPLILYVDAIDKDEDRLRYDWQFSIFEKYEDKTAKMKRTFYKKGAKDVKVTVSDGLEEITHEWKINVE